MINNIIFKESGLKKIKPKQVSKAINSVKTKTGKVGTVGNLHNGLLYKIIKNGFIIF